MKHILRRIKLIVMIGILITGTMPVMSSSTLAVSDSQRKIFDYSISYYNDCLTSGSSGIIAGNNKDYAGNQVFTDEELRSGTIPGLR